MKNYLLFILLLLSNISCKKQQPALPEATQNGAQTMGCYINGSAFIAIGKIGVNASTTGVRFTYDGTLLGIEGRSNDGNFYIGISVLYGGNIGTYKLDTSLNNAAGIIDIRKLIEYRTDAIHNNYVNITYFNGNIISGTFSFTGNDLNNLTANATNGRFDIKQ